MLGWWKQKPDWDWPTLSDSQKQERASKLVEGLQRDYVVLPDFAGLAVQIFNECDTPSLATMIMKDEIKRHCTKRDYEHDMTGAEMHT